MIYYHVTPLQNVPSIKKHGLIPLTGPLAHSANESKPAIYLFPTKNDMEDGMFNWLSDAIYEHYGENCKLAILHIHIPNSISIEQSSVGYECICRETIPAKYITFYDEDDNFI